MSEMSSDFSVMTISQLKKYASDNNISVTGSKLDIISAIEDGMKVDPVVFKQFQMKVRNLEAKLEALEAVRRNILAREREERFVDGGMIVMPRQKLNDLNPLEHSLDQLYKKEYYTPENEDENEDEDGTCGDSWAVEEEDYEVLREVLDEELDKIESSVNEHYQFKISTDVYERPVPLDLFISNSDAVLVGDKLCIGNESAVLGPGCPKATIVIASTKLTFLYYDGKWLVSADWM